MELRGVKQHQLVRSQLVIHEALTQLILSSTMQNTSKGKSLVPARKLEKNLKKAITNFQLSLDIHNNSVSDQLDLEESKTPLKVSEKTISFPEWFRTSIAAVYTEKIPNTIQYLCRSLDLTDNWVEFLIQQMRSKNQRLSQMSANDYNESMKEEQEEFKGDPVNAQIATTFSQSNTTNMTLSQLVDSNGRNQVLNSRKRTLNDVELDFGKDNNNEASQR